MIFNKKIISLFAITFLAVPSVIFAQPGVFNGTLMDVVGTIVAILLNILWIIAIAFVIVMFVVAGFKFLSAQGDMSKVGEARRAVIWGLAGVAVILLAWSVTAIISRQLGV